MLVIENIPFLPISYPVADQEDIHSSIFGRTDDTIETGIDDHLFTDKTGESVDGFIFSIDTAIDIHVASEKAYSCSSSVNDGVLFGMDTTAELVALAMWYFKFVSKAKAVFKTILGFSGSPRVSCGNDLVASDDDGADQATEAGAPSGHFFGNVEIVFIFGNFLGFHKNFSSF